MSITLLSATVNADALVFHKQVIASTVTFTAVARVEDFQPVQFKELQARALQVSQSSVVVTSVMPGSIIVDYYIQPEGVMTSFDDSQLSAIVATLAAPPAELTDAFGPALVRVRLCTSCTSYPYIPTAAFGVSLRGCCGFEGY